jgi:hypothetical protein
VNQKNITLILLAILAMMMLTLQQNQVEEVDESEKLLPALKENLNNLEKLEVRSASGYFNLAKQDQGWVVLEKNSYPVDFTMLSNLLEGLSKARLIEQKTARPENYSILEVSDVADEGSKAKQVTGFAENYDFSILIGKSSEGRGGQFVRRPEDTQVWLADRSLDVNTSVLAWLKPEFINIESGEIKKIEQFDEAGQLQFTIERVDGEDEFVLQNLPANRSLKYPGITGELAGSLENVRLIDVRPHERQLWPTSFQSIYTLVDGGKITIQVMDLEDKKWLHLTSTGKTGSDARPDGDGDGDGYATPGRWDYQVASYVFDEFTRNLDDLLAEQKDVPPE